MQKILIVVIIIVVTIGTISGAVFLKHKQSKKIPVMQSKENIFTTTVKNPCITIVYDNNPYKEGLKTAWGFSCLIRGTEKTILFDTGGDGSILLANLQELSINPEEIDLIVLSHIHGDHVGGLNSLLKKNSKVIVYLPESFPESFKDDIMEHGVKVVAVREPLKICEGIYSTGELGLWIKEQSLIIQTEKGLVVITGCAHPGIVKIVNKAKYLVQNDVLLVMGGFHLAGESKREIEKIVSGFMRLGVRYVGPCHCSGDNARQLFKKEYGENFINVGIGRVITMDDLKK